MKTCLSFLLAILSLAASAQQRWGIKVYHNTDLFSKDYYDEVNDQYRDTRDLHNDRFSIALQIQPTKTLSHEIELFIPQVNKLPEDISFPINYEFRESEFLDTEVDAYSVRYELIERISKKNKPITFHSGFGVNPYYVNVDYTRNTPNVSVYDSHTSYFGFSFTVVPRAVISLTDRLKLDIDIPVRVYTLRVENYKTDNPAVPSDRQESQEVRHKFLESVYTLRVGLSFLVNPSRKVSVFK
jgi:hypothetical protein